MFSNYTHGRGLTTFLRMAIASLFLLSYSPRVGGRRVLSEFWRGESGRMGGFFAWRDFGWFRRAGRVGGLGPLGGF